MIKREVISARFHDISSELSTFLNISEIEKIIIIS